VGYQAVGANYDPALFQRRIPKAEMAFLSQYEGRTSNELYRDKQFRRLMHEFVPDCTFHYGRDKSMFDALDEVIQGSSEPVQVRDGRYAMVFGRRSLTGPGRALLWIDMHAGIGLGAIFFYPSNGEPTPTLTIFSSQVNQGSLKVSELPAAFVQDMTRWAAIVGVPAVTTRYFINAAGKKTVLAHEEDYCKGGLSGAGTAGTACEEMNAEAARVDVAAAHFLDQTNYASNATLRMVAERSSAQ